MTDRQKNVTFALSGFGLLAGSLLGILPLLVVCAVGFIWSIWQMAS